MALLWLAWRRVAAYLRNNPEGARLLYEHVISPLLFGPAPPKAEDRPEPKKTKGTLV